jgi:hypothetical protein
MTFTESQNTKIRDKFENNSIFEKEVLPLFYRIYGDLVNRLEIIRIEWRVQVPPSPQQIQYAASDSGIFYFQPLSRACSGESGRKQKNEDAQSAARHTEFIAGPPLRISAANPANRARSREPNANKK